MSKEDNTNSGTSKLPISFASEPSARHPFGITRSPLSCSDLAHLHLFTSTTTTAPVSIKFCVQGLVGDHKSKGLKSNFTQKDLNAIKNTLSQHDLDLLEEIGTGGFASVFKVHHRVYISEFAIKIFRREDKNKKLLASFEKECQALCKLDHPNILKIYDMFSDENFLYFLMEYCQSGTLKDISEPLDYESFCNVAQQILSALSYCHSIGIAHCDIKPSNILFDQFNRVKLADFGLSQSCERVKCWCGSKPFMAPEIYLKEEYDPKKSDIWSLGLTFFYMATKKMPWISTQESKLKEEILSGLIPLPHTIDSRIGKIIISMLSPIPSARAQPAKLLERFEYENNKIQGGKKTISAASSRGSLPVLSSRGFTPALTSRGGGKKSTNKTASVILNKSVLMKPQLPKHGSMTGISTYDGK